MNKPSIFWCGSILNHDGILSYKGEAPSATQWSKGLISGFEQNGINVTCFSPIWDSLFPKGKLFPGNVKYLDSKIDQKLIRYLNFPFLRTQSVANALSKRILQEIKTNGNPLAIITYNPYPHYCLALERVIKKNNNIVWINLVLDLDDPERDNWGNFLNSTNKAKGNVFLSWWGYVNAPINNKLHLDAGWDGKYPQIVYDSLPKRFVYAGKLSKEGGIDDLINTIRIFPRQDVQFDIFGKGNNPDLNSLASVDSRVKLHGFVTDDILDQVCRMATGFLSPRDTNFHGTKMVFPSKLLFYLKYRKPIVSSLLPGLSPEYHNILIIPDSNSPLDWSNAIDSIINKDTLNLKQLSERIDIFLESRLWNVQAQKLYDYVKSLN